MAEPYESKSSLHRSKDASLELAVSVAMLNMPFAFKKFHGSNIPHVDLAPYRTPEDDGGLNTAYFGRDMRYCPPVTASVEPGDTRTAAETGDGVVKMPSAREARMQG